MICITIMGYEGVGKSTFAKYLAHALAKEDYFVRNVSLATPVKQLAKEYLDLDKEINRFKLEEFAEDLKFMFGKGIFANYLIDNTLDAGITIIDDFRFIEEYEALESEFDIIPIAITRDMQGMTDKDIYRYGKLREELTKRNVKIIDYTITYEEIYRTVDKVIELVKEKERNKAKTV